MYDEMEQRSFYGDDFYGDAPPIINASEPHMACLLLHLASITLEYLQEVLKIPLT